VKLAVAWDGDRLPADLLETLDAAGLPSAGLAVATGPSLIAEGDVEWVIAPAADVVTMCMLGGVDAGFVGKEALLEHDNGVVELLDLRTAPRRLVHAAPPASPAPRRRPRLATRFPRAARAYFAAEGREVDVVALASSSWLAIRIGLAGGIVEFEDVVARQVPELEIVEVIAETTTRLVAGRQSWALHTGWLSRLVDDLRRARRQP
jgi:ATP phosphoribosyltransferase